MNKRDKIDYLLSLVKEKAESVLDDEIVQTMDVTAEELLLAAFSEVLKTNVPTIKYSSPLGQVDKDNVIYRIETIDDYEIDISITGEADDSDQIL